MLGSEKSSLRTDGMTKRGAVRHCAADGIFADSA